MTTATDIEVIVITAAQWDQTVPCKTEGCEDEAGHALGIQHMKGHDCSVTVHYPSCDGCYAALWRRCQELADLNKPCAGCGVVQTSATDYIQYDRTL